MSDLPLFQGPIKNYATEVGGAVSGDGYRYCFPPIETIDRLGHTLSWQISVRLWRKIGGKDSPVKLEPKLFLNEPLDDTHVATISVESGVVGGKMRDVVPTSVGSGKNLGKKNQTNVFCQALADARGKYNKQRRVSLSNVAPEKAAGFVPPMLSQELDVALGADAFAKLTFPLLAQPKYDGMRALVRLVDGALSVSSRTGKPYRVFEALAAELKRVATSAGAHALDGELYIHGADRDVISGIVRSGRDPEQRLRFVLYDIQDFDAPAEKRIERIAAIMGQRARETGEAEAPKRGEVGWGSDEKLVRLAPCYVAPGPQEAWEWYGHCCREGYEGAMYRKFAAPYRPGWKNWHCADLLKLKPLKDGEFTITGWSAAKNGKAAGALMIECEAVGLDGKKTKFNVGPRMPLKQRREMAEAMPREFVARWLGKPLIVFFDKISKNGVPIQGQTDMKLREPE